MLTSERIISTFPVPCGDIIGIFLILSREYFPIISYSYVIIFAIQFSEELFVLKTFHIVMIHRNYRYSCELFTTLLPSGLSAMINHFERPVDESPSSE